MYLPSSRGESNLNEAVPDQGFGILLRYRREILLKQKSPMAVDPVEAQDTSCLAIEQYPWQTAPSYEAFVNCTTTQFEEVSNLLLSQPQLNSSHLFRADILYDSIG